jgi:RNA polymerase-interacting CarD/CdnL/TRCF family regulator
MSSAESELVANYWDSYFNWRTGQLDDAAIATVVRSIWEQVHLKKLPTSEVDQLKKLARMIEEEIATLDDEDEVTWVA